MARKPTHAEIEGFSRSKPILTTSFEVIEGFRISVCTGHAGDHWCSVARAMRVATGEFGRMLFAISTTFEATQQWAHDRAVKHADKHAEAIRLRPWSLEWLTREQN